MTKHLPPLLTATLFACAGFANAATPADACKDLADARAQLVAMVGSTDPATLDDYKAKVHAASDRLDADLASMGSGPDAAKAAEFKPVWEAFKTTRETEIIPLVYAGKNADAKAIATGVQAGRMEKMKAAMGCN